MKTFDIIPETKTVKEVVGEGVFGLFGYGNHKRDLVLLVRGDLKIVRPVCYSFFACINCGNMSICPGTFKKVDRGLECEICGQGDQVYYMDGVGFKSEASIEIGINDDQIKITKI